MKYYSRNRSGSAKFKKVMLRILFVLIAAAVITFLSIALGNHLKKKVTEAEENSVTSSDFIGVQMQREQEDPAEDNTGYHSPNVFGAGIDLTAYHTAEALKNDIQTLAETYDTLTVSLIDAGGELIYTSPALCELTRLPEPSENPMMEKLLTAIDAARGMKMRLCAMIAASTDSPSVASAATIDGTLMAELHALGFDEVLLTISDDYRTEIDYESANRIRAYLTECAKYTDCAIGVLLSSELYRNASMAKQVQLIASASTFLGISFPMDPGSTTADVYRSVTNGVTGLMGSFSVYNMRVIIGNGEGSLISAQYHACVENNVTNISFTTAVALDKLSYSGAAETILSEEPIEESKLPASGEENPYASTTEAYEAQAAAEAAQSEEGDDSEADSYDGGGWN